MATFFDHHEFHIGHGQNTKGILCVEVQVFPINGLKKYVEKHINVIGWIRWSDGQTVDLFSMSISISKGNISTCQG